MLSRMNFLSRSYRCHLMLRTIDKLILISQIFAFKTIFSGVSYTKPLTKWRERSYHVKLIFHSRPIPKQLLPVF